jgi:hypothetical protein
MGPAWQLFALYSVSTPPMDSGTVDEFRAPSGLAVGVPALLVVLFRDLQDRRVAL